MSTASRALFIYRNKNETPPESFLKKACEAYPSWSGVGIISDGVIEFSRDHEGPATVAGILSICGGEFKDKDILFTLGFEEGNAKLTEDHANLQPFDMINVMEEDKEITKVIAFVDGGFEEYATNPASEGRTYLFAGHRIAPFLHSIWDLCSGDADKFIEQIRMPHVEAMLLGMAGKNTSIAIMTTASDKPFVYYHNTENGDEYSWGFVNDTCGWEDKVPTNGSPNSTETRGSNNKNKSTLKMSASPVALETNSKDTSSPVMYNFRVNANIVKNADIRELYIKFHGKQPSSYQSRPAVSLLPNKYEEASKEKNISLLVVAGTAPVTKTPSATVPASATETAQQVLSAVAKDKLKKFVDANVLQVMSPEEMSKTELPLPTFWDQTGWNIDDFAIKAANKKEIIYKLLEQGYRDPIWELIRDLCYAYFQQQKDLERATTPETEKSVATPAPTGKNRFKMKT